jgi:hypothetical protein
MVLFVLIFKKFNFSEGSVLASLSAYILDQNNIYEENYAKAMGTLNLQILGTVFVNGSKFIRDYASSGIIQISVLFHANLNHILFDVKNYFFLIH